MNRLAWMLPLLLAAAPAQSAPAKSAPSRHPAEGKRMRGGKSLDTLKDGRRNRYFTKKLAVSDEEKEAIAQAPFEQVFDGKSHGGTNPKIYGNVKTKFGERTVQFRLDGTTRLGGRTNWNGRAAEEVWSNLQELAGRPALPPIGPLTAEWRDRPDGPAKAMKGYYRLKIDGAHGRLESDPRVWNRHQLNRVLENAPWALLMLDLDTKVGPNGQWKKLDYKDGKATDAIHRDHDKTLWGWFRPNYTALRDPNVKLTRFTGRPSSRENPVPTAMGTLLDSYVRGQVDIDFKKMFDEIDRIRAIDPDKLLRAMDPVVDEVLKSGAVHMWKSREQFNDAFLARRAQLPALFHDLVRDVVAEREARTKNQAAFLRSHRDTAVAERKLRAGQAFSDDRTEALWKTKEAKARVQGVHQPKADPVLAAAYEAEQAKRAKNDR